MRAGSAKQTPFGARCVLLLTALPLKLEETSMSYMPPNHTVTNLPEPITSGYYAPQSDTSRTVKGEPEVKKGDRVRKHPNGRRCYVESVYPTDRGLMAVVVDCTPNSRSPRERILAKKLILAN